MNSNFRLVSVLVFSAMTISTAAQAQQALPDKSVKQITSIDAAVHSNRSYNLLRDIQKQINTLQSQVDVQSLGTSQIEDVKANLKTLSNDVTNMLSELDSDIQTVQTQNDKIASGVNDTNSTLQNVSAEVARIDQQQVTTLNVVQGNEQARRTDDIEAQLASGKFEASAYVPGQSGKLDLIRNFVSEKASEAESSGWRDQEYKHYLTLANADYSKQNYHGALSNYHKAYKHLEGKVSHSFAPKSWFLSTFH